MNVYLTSDTHYFHDNIIKYCNRPFSSTEEMNEVMIQRWNEIVGPDDTCIHVGDLSAGLKGRTEELKSLIGRLNGKKILIRGNHDHQTDEWYISAGFSSVHDHINCEGILFVHYPLEQLVTRVNDLSQFGEVDFVIHGHTHKTDTPEYENHYNVAVDRNDFRPICMDTIFSKEIWGEKLIQLLKDI